VEDVVSSHPSVDHVELITWKAPPSRFDLTYESFWGAHVALPDSDSSADWRTRDLPDDRSSWTHSTDETDTAHLLAVLAEQQDSIIRAQEMPAREDEYTPQATHRSDDFLEVISAPDIEIDFESEPTLEFTVSY